MQLHSFIEIEGKKTRKKTNHICPLCNEQGFTTFLDKDRERKIKDLKVSCKLKFRGCEWTGELGRLERHLDVKGGDCEFVEVECDFSCLGCTVKPLRKDLSHHYNSNMRSHLMLSLRTTSRLEHQLQEQHQQQDEAMRAVWQSLHSKEQFHGDVTIQLINQRKDSWHVQKTAQMLRQSKGCIRVVDKKVNILGVEFEYFMVNTKLGYNRTTGTEYLKNDTLKFRVVSVLH